MLTFLQLSDIHFRSGPGTVDDDDPLDYDQREALIADARAAGASVGGISGVLVCGDVANTGGEPQYAQAAAWLRNLCTALDVDPWMVWTVPGNHDLDHARIETEQLECRATLREANEADLDAVLAAMLADRSKATALLAPFANYLAFASGYGCSFEVEQLHWIDGFDLGSHELELRGITSSLICGKGDNDTTNRMVIGDRQAAIISRKLTIRYSLCHHPQSWLLDRDEIEDRFREHINVRVTGHLHTRDLEVTPVGVYLRAGAVSPKRSPEGGFSPGFEPRYELITLSIATHGDDHVLDLIVRGRRWDDLNEAWGADVGVNGTVALRFTIGATAEPEEIAPDANTSAERLSRPRRELRYRLSELPQLDKYECAESVGAPLGEIMDLEPHQLVGVLFDWADRNDRLEDLWNAVTRHDGDELAPNPFEGPQDG